MKARENFKVGFSSVKCCNKTYGGLDGQCWPLRMLTGGLAPWGMTMPFSRSGSATQEESNKNSWNRVKQLLVQLWKEGKKWPAYTVLILITSFHGGRTFPFTWHALKLTWEEGQEAISWDLSCHKFSEWPRQSCKTFCFCVHKFIGLELIDLFANILKIPKGGKADFTCLKLYVVFTHSPTK